MPPGSHTGRSTEASICERYDLTPEQVAAARAYILRQPGVILDRYMLIEARMASGNPPEGLEGAEKARAVLLRLKEWLAGRELDEPQDQATESAVDPGSRDPGCRHGRQS